MIGGLTKYLTLDGTDLSFVFSPGTTSTKSGYLLSDGRTDLSDIFATKGANTANITGYKYISAGIENDINQLYAQITLFGVTFNIAFDSQFTKQTTTDGLYDVYTIIGQSGTDGSSLTWTNKSVVATFTAKTAKKIYYVCVGGGGYTYIAGTGSCGGGGAGAYYEGSVTITSDVSFNFTAGGSYKTSTITSTLLNVTAGRGGNADRFFATSENGINGSSGGGGGGGTSSTSGAGSGSSPGTNGGTAVGGTTRSGGGGGGAGSAGVNGSGGTGGAGGSGIIPSSTPIYSFYATPLCVGGGGHGGTSGYGATNSTYGSGAGGRSGDSIYHYGKPGAIIIAVPKT